MGFRTGAYATVWETRLGKGNYTEARISISKKNKQTDQYETDFNGFVRLIGDAHSKANTLSERSRIKIGDCDVTNFYSKEKNTTYTNYAVFNFENADNNSNQNQTTPSNNNNNDFMTIPDNVDDSGLPFN